MTLNANHPQQRYKSIRTNGRPVTTSLELLGPEFLIVSPARIVGGATYTLEREREGERERERERELELEVENFILQGL